MNASIFHTAPTCKCDFRGTQYDDSYREWCWLQETPCWTLNRRGFMRPATTWVPCVAMTTAGEIKVLECNTIASNTKTIF